MYFLLRITYEAYCHEQTINSENRAPEKVTDLIAHHRKHELVSKRKAFATIQGTGIYLKRHIDANWGSKRLQEIRTVEVEKWLHSLNYPPEPAARSLTPCPPCSITQCVMNGTNKR